MPSKNVKKLADAIQWLIENPEERKIMGKEGRKLAEKEFSIDFNDKDNIFNYKIK